MISAKRAVQVEPGESLLFAWDFTEQLADGETLTGTPTVTCTRATGGKPVAAATGDLTLSSKAVNTATIDNGEDGEIAIGKAVQARVVGQKLLGDYLVRAECGTSASNTLARVGLIQCRGE